MKSREDTEKREGSMAVTDELIEMGMVDPTDDVRRERQTAPPLDTLSGKTVGLLDNRKDNSNMVLHRVGERLKSDYGVETVNFRQKFIFSMVADPSILDELAESCDAVVTAIAD